MSCWCFFMTFISSREKYPGDIHPNSESLQDPSEALTLILPYPNPISTLSWPTLTLSWPYPDSTLFHIKYELLLLTYKSIHALAPQYLTDLLKDYVCVEPLDMELLTIYHPKKLTLDPSMCQPLPSGTLSPWRFAKRQNWILSSQRWKTLVHSGFWQLVCFLYFLNFLFW